MLKMKLAAGFALLSLFLLLARAPVVAVSDIDTVLLSDPSDPFYPLAEEIARTEVLPLVHTWAEAAGLNPLYIVWVVAPLRLSDEGMAEAGLAIKNMASLPAVGLLTANSLEDARALWQRAALPRSQGVRSDQLFAANGEYPTAGINEPRLTAFQGDAPHTQPLTPASLSAALQQADYLTFTGHGAAHYLQISEDVHYGARDLPDLPPLVVGTASCQTVRPWRAESIVLGFIKRGAAAYAGFVYSPLEGYLIGEFRDLPFRYTWPDFPVGRVVALQNHGTLQGFANFPFYHLVGSPRIALNAQPPYRLLSEDRQPGQWVLSYSALDDDTLPASLMPVRITGGAAYAYVAIEGVGSATADDPFFNARLQVMDAQGDKYILFSHPGGPFTIRLLERAPWHWPITRPLLDSLDNLVLFSPQGGGDVIVIALGLLALAAGLWRAWRRRSGLAERWQQLALMSLGTGAGTGLALGAYAWLRLPYAAITAKPLAISLPWLFGAGLLAAAGVLLYRTACTRSGRMLAVLVPALPALLPALLISGMVTIFNILYAVPQLGAGIYGYRMAIQYLPAAVLILLVFAVGLRKQLFQK